MTLAATLRVASEPARIEMEAGMVHVEPIRLPLSDPTSSGILAGRIVDPDARLPIRDAEVRLGELNRVTTSNSRGYFTFGSQPWGLYTLEITRLGYATATSAVRVAGNLSQIVEIEVAPDALKDRKSVV